MHVTAEIKDSFFDRQRVIESVGRANAKKLGRMGAFVQRRAQTNILRRDTSKKRSFRRRPGKPPRVRSRSKYASLRNIQFGLSNDQNAVAIGPLFVPSLRPKGSSAQTTPELLTKGGTARVPMHSENGADWVLGPAPQAAHHREITARYDEHPFMGPALDKEIAAGTVTNVWSAK